MRYDLRSPAFRPAALAAEAAEARAFVVALLAYARPGVWYTFDDLLNLVWRVNPLFLRGRQQAYTIPAWRLERATDGRALRPTVREEWMAGEGAYLRALLTGPLHWWGALDLLEALPAPNTQAAPVLQPIAFRLTNIGAFLLGGEAGAEEQGAPTVANTTEALPSTSAGSAPAAGVGQTLIGRMTHAANVATEALAGDWGAPLLLTGDGALAAHPLAASASQLNALGGWARVTGVAGGRLIYTLSADLACAAFDRGQTPGDAVAAMQATGRVAERVQAQLERWRAAYGDARIEAGWALLEARVRLLAPTLAVVHPADLAALRAALARKGYMV